jgi:hypothetical protein
VVYYSDISGRVDVPIRLGFQSITAIDDGGVSMYFQSTSSRKEESRCTVLSVEV